MKAVVVFSLWIALASALTAHAQSITTIFSFKGGTNGGSPKAALTLGPDGNFYGATGDTVFRVTTKGTLTTLANFNGANAPSGALTLGPDGNFYGTTYEGGRFTNGTVFRMTTNGLLTALVNFDNTNGSYPEAALTLGPDGNFYGTTSGFDPGGGGNGTVFRVTTNGVLTTLVNFNGTNGKEPQAGLTLGLDGNFYGGTESGGTYGTGTVFRVTTNGTLTTLVNVNGTNGSVPDTTMAVGPDGNFYSTTDGGVFKMTTNGVATTLEAFNGNDGQDPQGALTLGPDGNIYGTTAAGGNPGYGIVFKVTTNGAFTTLVNFNYTNGANPFASLTRGPDGSLYGTTESGGSAGLGTIYRLDLPPDFIVSPSNLTAVIGSTATFNCQLFGTAPLAYQWLSDGVPITGATNATLSFNPVVLTNEIGGYQLVVTNAYGSVTSQLVSLDVQLQPNTYAISNSGGGNFTVYLAGTPNTRNRLWAATNPAPPFAQWQVIATNVTDDNGLAQFQDTNTAGIAQKFYRLSYP